MIDRERLQKLHERIVAGDHAAPGELFALVHRAVTVTIWKKPLGRRDWEAAADLATDAIMEYLKSPNRFDQTRSSLFSYLVMIARGDALNHIRDKVRANEKQQRAVELALAVGNPNIEETDLKLDAVRILNMYGNQLLKDPGDEEILKLYLKGERDTDSYAVVLGIAHLPATEQKKRVKTRRDRIEQRLKRLKESLG
jgi:RNA polymerase sigma factor (sigma-70 family)